MHAEVMQPDEATLSKILGDSSLLEGFQDPTVMEAVAEIAQDPDAFQKYAANAKASSTIPHSSHSLTACTSVVSLVAITEVVMTIVGLFPEPFSRAGAEVLVCAWDSPQIGSPVA